MQQCGGANCTFGASKNEWCLVLRCGRAQCAVRHVYVAAVTVSSTCMLAQTGVTAACMFRFGPRRGALRLHNRYHTCPAEGEREKDPAARPSGSGPTWAEQDALLLFQRQHCVGLPVVVVCWRVCTGGNVRLTASKYQLTWQRVCNPWKLSDSLQRCAPALLPPAAHTAYRLLLSGVTGTGWYDSRYCKV